MQQQWTISWLDCGMRQNWVLYDNQQWQAQWLDWEDVPKHFPKPNLHQKRVMVTVLWSAAHLMHYRFLNPSKIITSEKYAQQIDEIHRKLQCVLSALINRKDPILRNNSWQHITQATLQKLNKLGYKAFFITLKNFYFLIEG